MYPHAGALPGPLVRVFDAISGLVGGLQGAVNQWAQWINTAGNIRQG